MRHSPVFSFRIRNFVAPIIESVRTPARITPYPTGRLFWGGAVPGTSCQATIAPSLRDISQQALASEAAATGPGYSRRGCRGHRNDFILLIGAELWPPPSDLLFRLNAGIRSFIGSCLNFGL